jgi:para-aminobenzoate synthetase component 1
VVAVPVSSVGGHVGVGEVTHHGPQGFGIGIKFEGHNPGSYAGGVPLLPPAGDDAAPLAVVGGRLLTGLADVTGDLAALDTPGHWAVVAPYDAAPVCARFTRSQPARPWPGPPWQGPDPAAWTSSLDKASFTAAVDDIRATIAAGDVYQVNLTRRLSAPMPSPEPGRSVDVAALGAALASGNPAPYSAVVRLPAHGVHVASASPERFVARDGNRVWSSPIKGTAATADAFTAKDRAENVMIVDLVRNDLGRVCEFGSVQVPSLLATEQHPGLVHLVSTVAGTLRPGMGWADLFAATFPPGSVTGAPKLAAMDTIARLEPVDRGVYCGAVGWVDGHRCAGELNVAIRTFWIDDDHLHLGTGGAITWDSTADGEWAETELKARRLLAVASGDGRVG